MLHNIETLTETVEHVADAHATHEWKQRELRKLYEAHADLLEASKHRTDMHERMAAANRRATR